MTIRRLARPLLVASLVVLAAAPARSDEAAAPAGLKAELLHGVDDAASKLEDLAAATPQAKYSYRPGKGVRSTAEVFLHVAYANNRLPMIWGVKATEGLDLEPLEKSTTDKAAIQKILEDSFEHVRQAVRDMPDTDWDRVIEMFGNKTTVRGGYLVLLSHMHEHLGQSIAYARVNGIVPPWTARAQEAAKKKNASGM